MNRKQSDNQHVNQLVNQSGFREFLSYAMANVMAMMGLSCYVLADTFFIARGLGSDGLAALNLTIPLYNFMQGSGMLIGMGGATRFAIYKSQGRDRDANHAFTESIQLMILLSVLLVTTGLALSGMITIWMGGNEATYDMCHVYIRTLYMFSPAFLLNYVLLCFVRNDGAPKLAMAAMLAGSFVNIILDYIFIFPLNMGMFGAVLATGISPIVSLLVLLPFFIKKKHSFHLCKDAWNVKKNGLSSYAKIIFLGIPAFISEVSAGVVILVFNRLIVDIQGNIGVAAYGVVANISLVVLAIYTGIAEGIQPLFSKYYGMGDARKNRNIMRYAILTVIVLSVISYGMIFFGAEWIAGVFNEEQNLSLQQIAVNGLRIYFTGAVFAGMNVVFANYFSAVNEARPGTIVSVLRGLVLIVPMAIVLTKLLDMTGVWLTFPITEIMVSILAIGLYVYGRKQSMKQIVKNSTINDYK